MKLVRRKAMVQKSLAALLATTMFAAPALAQDASVGAAASRRVVDGEKILDLLVAKGVFTREEADRIVAQATVEPAAPAAPAPVTGGVAGNVQTIPYIPEPVLAKVREQVRDELAQKAQVEGWAAPGALPEWTQRITISGDVRVRGEAAFLPDNNYDSFLNYNAINNGQPFDTNEDSAGFVNPPFLNGIRDRNGARIRARLRVGAKLTDSIAAEIRLATGNDSTPVSTNQWMGAAPGNFSKYSIWLDRANIRIAPKGLFSGTTLVAGRAANPFWTSELIFDQDLNFDGFSLHSDWRVGKDVGLFTTVGAFPVYNSDYNFGSRDVSAFESRDRWLLAAQAGVNAAFGDDLSLRAAAGYFRFTRARGVVSSPCGYLQDVCDTDNTRPLFMQFGNSVFPIRNNQPNPDPTVDPDLSPNPQYFGLASDFHVLEAQGELVFNKDGAIPVSVSGEFVKNLAFDKRAVLAVQSNVIATGAGSYDPGAVGWGAALRVGRDNPINWGEWKLLGGYRHIDTDAVIDAFNSSEFHNGGTNARGFFLSGSLGIGGGTSIGGRYYATEEVTGPRNAIDTLIVDLNAEF